MPEAASLLLGSDPEHNLVELEVRNPALHGAYIQDLNLPGDCFVLSVKSEDRQLVSHGNTNIRIGDRITVGGTPENLETAAQLFHGTGGAGRNPG